MRNVNPITLKTWLEQSQAVLIDVREPAEHAAKSIPGAKPVPLNQISAKSLPAHQDKKLVLHCGGGGRSAKACDKLAAELPGIETYNLEGGIRAWEAAGLPVEPGWYPLDSLEKQLRIIAGFTVLVGMILGFWVAGIFHIFAIAAGAGLLYSGLAGECRLMTLLLKMPWNSGKSLKESAMCMLKKKD
jgi:rhodanese-related sulfurtransferase